MHTTRGGLSTPQRALLALLPGLLCVACGAAQPPAATQAAAEAEPAQAQPPQPCPLPQMDARRFALDGGPSTCDLYEERCNRECMGGDARYCHLLGLTYLQPAVRRGHTRRDPDPAVAAELFHRACQLGLPEGCVAWARSEQPWAEPDSCQQPVMARACELDVAEGCRAAAWFAAQAGHRPEAATLLQRACELGDHRACADLAAATTLAPGEDPEPLRRLLFAACFRGDHEPSCVRLAVALEDGLLSGHPSSEAGVVWEQACRLNARHCGRVPPPAPPTAGTDAAAGALYAEPVATAGAPNPSERRGSLSADVIRTVIRSHLAEVEACYIEALRRDATLRGTVTVRFLIEADGHVSAATPVGDTLGDTDATQCMARVVTSWRFPAPEGGGRVSVTYPFTLETH